MFELVNFRSPYHCVLGRQALAKFMASTHYAYNIMKIPGPNGPISTHGNPTMALECESEGGRMADAVIAEEENKQEALAKYTSGVDSNDPSILKKPTTPSSAPTQTQRHRRIPTLRPARGGAKNLTRHPRRRLRAPRRSSLPGRQSLTPRVLLAHGTRRCD